MHDYDNGDGDDDDDNNDNNFEFVLFSSFTRLHSLGCSLSWDIHCVCLSTNSFRVCNFFLARLLAFAVGSLYLVYSNSFDTWWDVTHPLSLSFSISKESFTKSFGFRWQITSDAYECRRKRSGRRRRRPKSHQATIKVCITSYIRAWVAYALYTFFVRCVLHIF